MRVRMLTPEKLGRVYEIDEARAADLIARGVAELVPEATVAHGDPAPVKRGRLRTEE